MFAVNGAFLPLCSKEHLPGYEKLYDSLRTFDIHEIYCLAMNDSFVMRQWGHQVGLTEEKVNPTNPLNPGNFKKVKLLPDSEGEFSKAMGMTTHFEGIGEKSWRYSMVLNDRVIEKLFVEQVRSYNFSLLFSHRRIDMKSAAYLSKRVAVRQCFAIFNLSARVITPLALIFCEI